MAAREANLVLGATEALQWALCHRMLREIVIAGLRVWPALSMFVPDGGIYRGADADNPNRSGIHAAGPPYRAVDGSGRNLARSTDAKWEACGKIAATVNRQFVYDPQRPEKLVAVGAKHGTGPHVHFQMHPNTVRARQS